MNADGKSDQNNDFGDVASERRRFRPRPLHRIQHGTDARLNVWRMKIDGSEPKQLTNGGGEYLPQCSPDGQWVIYSEVSFDNLSKSATWKVPIDGGHAVRITDRHSANPTVSPDGKLLAYYDRSQGFVRAESRSFRSPTGSCVKTLDLPPRARFRR